MRYIIIFMFISFELFSQSNTPDIPIDWEWQNYLGVEWINSEKDISMSEDLNIGIIKNDYLFFLGDIINIDSGKWVEYSNNADLEKLKNKFKDYYYVHYINQGVSILDLTNGNAIKEFYGAMPVDNISKNKTFILNNNSSVFKYNIELEKNEWENKYSRPINFTYDCELGYIVFEWAKSKDTIPNCHLLDKATGNNLWSISIYDPTFHNQWINDNKLYYKAEELNNIGYIDLKTGKINKISDGNNLYIGVENLYIYQYIKGITLVFDKKTLKIKDSLTLKGPVFTEFNNYLICESPDIFYIHDNKTGQLLTMGNTNFKNYFEEVQQDEYDYETEGDGVKSYFIYFLPQIDDKLIGIGTDGEIVCLKNVKKK